MCANLISALRSTLCLLLVAVCFSADQSALAQSSSCSKLANTLKSLDRNREFRKLDANIAAARNLGAEIQDNESLFVRGGCQKQLNDGARLSRECRNVARHITTGRANYNKLAASINTGQAVAEQRELALQQIARFGCGTGTRSSARVTLQDRSSNLTLLDRLFGRQEQFIDDEYGFEFGGRSTLRTVCVRACDGYYWPVSFSTVDEFLVDDSAQCQAQCPGSDVSLYYYRNPGEGPEEMVNLNGQSYAASENAFAYRQAFNNECSCKQQITYGTIDVATGEDGTVSRPMISFEDQHFPMPVRDPRHVTEKVVVAELIHVPLPKRRPIRPGEEALFPTPILPVAVPKDASRTVQFGERTIRVVGPDTPYAQSKATGS